MISEIEQRRNELDYDLDGAVLRLADRTAYAAAGTRANSPARRARVQVRRRGEDDAAGRRDLGRRQDRQGRAGRRARARVRRRHDRHARHARQPGGDPRARRADRRHGARAPRRRRDPVRGGRARRRQAHGRRAGDRPAVAVPVLRPRPHRAGQLARAVLHQRGLPGPDGPPPDPLGEPRGRGHRRDRPEVDRAPQRGRQARPRVGLLRARPRRRCSSSTASARSPRTT